MSAYKVMLLGEIGVGKSSLARRLVTGQFDSTYTPTIGVDVYKYQVPDGRLPAHSSLIIWDTDGNFGDVIFQHVYMKEASAALIVGDVMRPPTLDTMLKLAEGFRLAMPGRHLGYLVNKIDLLPCREQPVLPTALASPGTDLELTSALTGENVIDSFCRAAAVIHRRAH